MEVGNIVQPVAGHDKEMEDSKQLESCGEKGICGICSVKLELPEPEDSPQYLSSYLKTHLNQLFQEKGKPPPPQHLIGIYSKSELKVSLCGDCGTLNQKCSELSGKLEEVQEELSSCLRIAEEKVTKCEADGLDQRVSNQGMKVLEAPEMLTVSNDPLQNPVILAHLFNLCPLDLLAKARLVCKQWHHESLTPWRSSLPLTFRLLSNKIHVGNHFTPFEDFLEFCNDPFNECETKPFRWLKLEDWKFTSNIEQLQVFWKELRHGVTSLVLRDCIFPNVEAFRKVVFKCCPKLQRLAIIMCTFRPPSTPLELDDASVYKEPICGEHKHLRHLKILADNHNETRFLPYDSRLPVSWLELLSHFPSLASLELLTRTITGPELQDVWENILKSIKIIKRHDRSKLRLKNFTLLPPPKIVPSDDKLLREVELPLNLTFIMLQSRDNGQYVKTILETYADHLCQVAIFRDSEIDLHWSSIPIDVTLEKLWYFRLKYVLPDNMEFLKYMPKLVTLHMTDLWYDLEEGPSSYSYEFNNMITHSWRLDSELQTLKLTHLTDFACSYIVTKDDLACLIKWMPNMKTLEMLLDDGQFRLVCQYWTELEGLKVRGDMITDEGVTGIGRDGEKTNRPNIAHLRSLKYFCFWSRRLTDVSVLQGLVKLPNLNRIQPCGEGLQMQLGRDAARALCVRRITIVDPKDDVNNDEGDPFNYFN